METILFQSLTNWLRLELDLAKNSKLDWFVVHRAFASPGRVAETPDLDGHRAGAVSLFLPFDKSFVAVIVYNCL